MKTKACRPTEGSIVLDRQIAEGYFNSNIPCPDDLSYWVREKLQTAKLGVYFKQTMKSIGDVLESDAQNGFESLQLQLVGTDDKKQLGSLVPNEDCYAKYDLTIEMGEMPEFVFEKIKAVLDYNNKTSITQFKTTFDEKMDIITIDWSS